jgi:hypothetical protein
MALDSNLSPRDLLTIALGGDAHEVRDRSAAIEALRRRLSEEEQQMAFALRHRGASWADVGHAFGMSKQAAHERFAQGAGLIDKLDTAMGRTPKP